MTAPASENGKLGTFGGVFVPSLLTILGVVMFMLFGQVTGQAGLSHTIMIVLLANTVSILTSLSLAVIATNAKVGGGGDYFLTSRSLGLEMGGAIGTVLYLAQSMSVGFYVVGFTEAFVQVLGVNDALAAAAAGHPVAATIFGATIPAAVFALPLRALISTGMTLLMFAVAWRGADVGTKVQYFILYALVLALASYFVGAYIEFDVNMLSANVSPAPTSMLGGEYHFWGVFAIFFPAITGFTQGVSMSGDLKDPQKSLPVGTFFAVGVSMVVYLVLPFFLAGTSTRDQLLGDPGALTMKRHALVPALVDVGVFAATLSSALASMMGAPRILTAMASDRIFPGARFFAKAHEENSSPRRAMLLTLLIGTACVWAGELSAIAQVVTMFFLLSYGALNWATFVEGFSRNPSFRPRFRFSGWRTSLAGAVVCGSVMLAIDPLATIVAGAVLLSIYHYLRSRGLEHPAGDVRRGFYVQRIKDYLLKLAERPLHARTWRPVVLAVTETDDEQEPITRFARAVSSSQGVLTLVTVLVGPFDEMVPVRRKRKEELAELARTRPLDCFHEVAMGSTAAEALTSVLLVHGIGELRANTLFVPWEDDDSGEYATILNTAAALEHNVVILHAAIRSAFSGTTLDDVPGKRRCIDVWWRGHGNGTLALLLAHLVRENGDWRGATIRLLRIEREEDARPAAQEELDQLVQNSRIAAGVQVVVDQRTPFDVITEVSRESHLVFMGVGGIAGATSVDLQRYLSALQELPTTALVFAAQSFDVEV